MEVKGPKFQTKNMEFRLIQEPKLLDDVPVH